MARIFISYRRKASVWAASRIFDRLARHFGRDYVFMDVSNLEPGSNFANVLDEQVAQCAALIALIGPEWIDLKDDDGKRRLDNPRDYVRMEIEGALKRKIRVIPVLVDGAQMPRKEVLPGALKALEERHAMEVTVHNFDANVVKLIRVLERIKGLDFTVPGDLLPPRKKKRTRYFPTMVKAAVVLSVAILILVYFIGDRQ